MLPFLQMNRLTSCLSLSALSSFSLHTWSELSTNLQYSVGGGGTGTYTSTATLLASLYVWHTAACNDRSLTLHQHWTFEMSWKTVWPRKTTTELMWSFSIMQKDNDAKQLERLQMKKVEGFGLAAAKANQKEEFVRTNRFRQISVWLTTPPLFTVPS